MTVKKKKKETREKLGKVHKIPPQKEEKNLLDAKSIVDQGGLSVDFSDLLRVLNALIEKIYRPPEKKKLVKIRKPK